MNNENISKFPSKLTEYVNEIFENKLNNKHNTKNRLNTLSHIHKYVMRRSMNDVQSNELSIPQENTIQFIVPLHAFRLGTSFKQFLR